MGMSYNNFVLNQSMSQLILYRTNIAVNAHLYFTLRLHSLKLLFASKKEYFKALSFIRASLSIFFAIPHTHSQGSYTAPFSPP